MTINSPPPADLSRIQRVSVKDLALEQLKRYIVSGAVQKGERLPSERELAQRLGVGRNSVREALKVLEVVGIVESRIGEGTFITEQTGASIGRTIGLNLATWGDTLVEIMDARLIVEVETAAAVARLGDDVNLAPLEAELTRMTAAGKDVYAYLAGDMNFHRALAKTTGNAIIGGIISNLIDLLEEVLREAHADQINTVAEGGATHQQIFAAITERNPEAAAAAMRRHLRFSKDFWSAVTVLGRANDEATRAESAPNVAASHALGGKD